MVCKSPLNEYLNWVAAPAMLLPGFMPYTKIAPERLQPGHKGDLSYLVGKKVRVRVVQVRGREGGGLGVGRCMSWCVLACQILYGIQDSLWY